MLLRPLQYKLVKMSVSAVQMRRLLTAELVSSTHIME